MPSIRFDDLMNQIITDEDRKEIEDEGRLLDEAIAQMHAICDEIPEEDNEA